MKMVGDRVPCLYSPAAKESVTGEYLERHQTARGKLAGTDQILDDQYPLGVFGKGGTKARWRRSA